MASNVSDSNAEVVEIILNELLAGSVLQLKEVLDLVEDVDEQDMWQKKFLHAGVKLVKANWVEEVLARGADPNLTDENQVTALSVAEEMVRQGPEDSGRLQVLKLLTLVHRRDQAVACRQESSSSSSTDLESPVARPDIGDNASLMSRVDVLGEEMKSIVRQMSSSFEEFKGRMHGRDTLLRCLGDAVTSIVEDVASIKSGLLGENVVRPLPSSDPAQTRLQCVNAMMRRTEIVHGDGSGFMRRLYEGLYDEDDCTACILKYLIRDDRVKVSVDCESGFIVRLRRSFVDSDGSECDGNRRCSFCDFDTETVYLGAKVSLEYGENHVRSRLIRALSQLAFKFAFRYVGRPYKEGDAQRELEWMRALQKVEKKQEKRGNLHFWFSVALRKSTLGAKVCGLAATVPAIIALEGSTEGRAILQEEAPLLFLLYYQHVLPTLIANARG